MQWKNKGSPTPKKCCVQQSAGKIMATVFWVSEGVLLLELLPDRTAIIGDTYAFTMVALRENIKQIHHGKLSPGVLLLHDNAPVHRSRTLRAAIRTCGFVDVNHLTYSADLAPSDYFLFRNLKKILCGRQFPMTMQSRKL